MAARLSDVGALKPSTDVTKATLTATEREEEKAILAIGRARHSEPAEGVTDAAVARVRRLRDAEIKDPSTVNAVVIFNWAANGLNTAASIMAVKQRLIEMGCLGFGGLCHDCVTVVGWHLRLYDTQKVNTKWHVDALAAYVKGAGHPPSCRCCKREWDLINDAPSASESADKSDAAAVEGKPDEKVEARAVPAESDGGKEPKLKTVSSAEFCRHLADILPAEAVAEYRNIRYILYTDAAQRGYGTRLRGSVHAVRQALHDMSKKQRAALDHLVANMDPECDAAREWQQFNEMFMPAGRNDDVICNIAMSMDVGVAGAIGGHARSVDIYEIWKSGYRPSARDLAAARQDACVVC